jgi:hypothetical protein
MKTPDDQSRFGHPSGEDAEPLSKLFGSARGDGFTPAETQELWKRVGPLVGIPAHPPGSNTLASGSASQGAGALSLKTVAAIVLAGAVASVGIAGGMVGRGLDHPGRTSSHAAATQMPPPVPPIPSELQSANAPVVRSMDTGPARGDVPAPTPLVRAPLSQPRRTGSALRPVSPSPASLESQPTQEHAEARSESESKADRPEGAEAATPSPSPLASTSSAPSFRPEPGEGALLLRARQELASNPSATLELTRRHAGLYPAGELVPEREVLAIEALVQLGRIDEAQARFADFRARFPESPHLARLRGLLRR